MACWIHHLRQPQMHVPVLTDTALFQGKAVVRLKGGFPSVFSRCSSELQALAEAGCTAELVPGVSSALAAPLFAGMPCRLACQHSALPLHEECLCMRTACMRACLISGSGLYVT